LKDPLAEKIDVNVASEKAANIVSQKALLEQQLTQQKTESLQEALKVKMPPGIFGILLTLLCSLPLLKASDPSDSMIWHSPMQIYWTLCLLKLLTGLENAGAKPISRLPLLAISFASFIFIPVFNPHISDLRIDPFLWIWALTQFAMTYLIGNYFDELDLINKAKKGFNNRIKFTLIGNLYLLIGLSTGPWLNVPFLMNTFWFLSQFSFIFIAGWTLRDNIRMQLNRQPTNTEKNLAFVTGEEIRIVYRAFPGVERWIEQRVKQQGSGTGKGLRMLGLALLAPVLLFGGLLIARMLITSNEVQSAVVETTTQNVPVATVASAFPQFLFFALGGIFLVFLARMKFNRMPSHLILNAKGIGFHFGRNLRIKPKMVHWSSLSKISIVKPTGQTSNLRDQLCFHQANGQVMKVNLNALDSYEDKEWILKAIKTWAPSVHRDASVVQCLEPPADYSYTELWLQALSAPPKRERLKPLIEGVKLKQGKYQVEKSLGVGGQGTAYLATDVITGDQIVLKEFILPVYVDVNVRKSALEQFENEARILRQLDHPQIVKLVDYFVEDHRAYLVLEHIDGKSLQKIVEEKGPLPEGEVVSLAKQMCKILEHLHGLSPPVVHRDFTPDNLILSSNGVLKLIDFNVAQQQESTTSGTVVGKQAYLPPEQFRGMPTSQSDIYSMGATLHFLLTGQEPEPISVSHPKRVNASVSEKMNSLVEHSTAIDCSKRYEKIEHLERDLMD
jgi:tRNA A-37 threonylcarbamoyl transferase component Bud32